MIQCHTCMRSLGPSLSKRSVCYLSMYLCKKANLLWPSQLRGSTGCSFFITLWTANSRSEAVRLRTWYQIRALPHLSQQLCNWESAYPFGYHSMAMTDWPISNQRPPHYIFSAGFPGVEAIIRVSTVYFWVFVGLLRPMGSHSYLASTLIFRGEWAFGFLTSSYAMVRTKNDGLLNLAPFDRWIDYVKIYINIQWILGKANKGQNRIANSSRSKTCDVCRSLFNTSWVTNPGKSWFKITNCFYSSIL